VILVNPLKKLTSKMTSSFTQSNLDSYLKHAIRRGRFGSFSGELPINEVPAWQAGSGSGSATPSDSEM
jgi:hypothetical protein